MTQVSRISLLKATIFEQDCLRHIAVRTLMGDKNESWKFQLSLQDDVGENLPIKKLLQASKTNITKYRNLHMTLHKYLINGYVRAWYLWQ